MKRNIWLSFVLLLFVVSAHAQSGITKQLGVAYQYNGKKPRAPLGKVYVKVASSVNGVLSDSVNGTFTLQLPGLQMGARIGGVQVIKRGMMVFNQQAVDEWTIRQEPLRLILCDADEFERERRELIAIGEQQAKKRYDQKVAAIEKKFKAESAEWYQKLSEADEERQKLQKHLSEYADALARIDQSELDNQMQEVLQLYYNGEVSKAIRILDNMRLSESLIHTLNQKHILEQDSAHQVEAIRSSIILYKNSGEWDKAAQLLKLLADQVNTPKEISSYALFCHQQNKFEEAIKYFQRELEMEQHLAKENQHFYEPHIAVALRNLGSLYYETQKFSEAETMYRSAIDILQRYVADNVPSYKQHYAYTLSDLGMLCIETQRLGQADTLLQQAIDIWRQLVKDDPQTYEPDLALTLDHLAFLYRNTQNIAKAEMLYNEELDIYRRSVIINPQKYTPELGKTLSNFANMYDYINKPEEAEAMYKEALEVKRRLVKDNPQAYEPDLAATLVNFAFFCSSDPKRIKEAEDMYLESLSIYKRLETENPPAYEALVILTSQNLAILYTGIKRYDEAEKMFQEVLNKRRRLASAFPQVYEPDLALSLNNLGSLYNNLERYAEAEKIYREALVIRRRLAGVNPQHEPALAMSLNNLAGLYRDTHRLEEAEKMYQEALSIRRGLAERNPQTYTRNVAKTLKDMSKLYIYMKDFKKAEKHVREALSLNPAEPSYVENLIAALLFQGKSAEAENLCRKYKEEVKDDMLEDLQLFAEEGIIPKKCEADVEKIKKILNEQ